MEKQVYLKEKIIIILSMSFAFFARNSFEIAHVCGTNWSSDNGQMIDLSNIISTLVVFEEEHEVLHILKLDKLQRND